MEQRIGSDSRNIRSEDSINKAVHVQHYIVAIGASAGGLEAIHEFFDNTGENTNVSFVVIQHLSPDYKSLLVELVSKHTHMKVYEAEHNMRIHVNCVYVIPNNKLMTVKNGALQLADKSFDKGPNTAIDTFFYSLAQDQGPYSVAVILSGTGSDGTRGAEAVKKAGGLVIAQDPATAKFDGMPNSSISSGNVDHVLSPQLMPEEIYEYVQEVPVTILTNGRIDNGLLEEIFRLVYHESGHDFNYYKTPTIIRRISRRMMLHGFKRLEEYVSFLKEHPEEPKVLGKDFLIGVTKFFRDPGAYEVLYNEIFPEIVSRKNEGDIIKIWISACSTGEEAYSVAILLDKYLHSKNKFLEVKIFATDVDASAIEVASKGIYPDIIEKDIDRAILQHYFIKEGSNYMVTQRIRKQIVFAKHNIIKDPPFIKNDLSTCRNMLIYMNNVLQRKVLITLHFSLSPDGFLFLGPSESAGVLKENLTEVNTKWKFYRRNGLARIQTGDVMFKPMEKVRPTRDGRPFPFHTISDSSRDLLNDFRDVLAEEFGFAAFYVDGNYDIKESIGDFKKYLSLPDKKLHLNILKMVPAELSVALNTAIRKAVQEQKRVHLKSVRIKEKNKQRLVSVTVKPGIPFVLIVLGELRKEQIPAEAAIDFSSKQESETNKYIMELEVELKQTRTDLQMAIEGLETTNEELQSSNEELLSANEELQSGNEELQSLNEELHTLNTEHQLKIKELIELNDDLNNYFRSTEIGQIFLDRNMRIRKFNPAAVNLVNLIETDIGRPFSHISSNIQYEHLNADVRHVIDTNEKVEREIELGNGKKSLMRVLPYVKQDKQFDGVVISFVDISALKDLDNIVKGVFNANTSAIMVVKRLDEVEGNLYDYKLVAANHAADKLLGKNSIEYLGKSIRHLFPDVQESEVYQNMLRKLQQRASAQTEFSVQSNDFTRCFDIVVAKLMDGFVVTVADITDKKLAEQKLKKSYEELLKAQQELRVLNERLEEKVIERTQQLTESNERFRLVSKATNEVLWDWNLLDDEIWWSDSYYVSFGIDPHDVSKKRRAYWELCIYPNDRERVVKTLQESIKDGSTTWQEEYAYRASNGEYVRILDRAYILHDKNGNACRMLGSMLDVTSLRKAEGEVVRNIEQRTFMAESMPLIVWSASPSGEIDFLNQQFYNYSGYTHKEHMQELWESIIHPEDLEHLKNVWKEALEKKQDFFIELRLKKHDGQYCWHLLRARAKKDTDGNLVSWIGTNTDVHEQKTYRETLEERVKERTRELEISNEELEASNIELQQFASVASHDLKEPLRKIHMFSHLLKEKYHNVQNDPAQDYLERIIGSSARMTSLVNDLLTFSRLSVTHLFRLTDLNLVVDEILADVELLIREKDAQIEVGELPQLEAVPGQMRQVFQNILTNALKFSKKNQRPVVKIEAECIAEKSFDSAPHKKGEFYKISISDNGIGFDEQYREKIFTIFQRLHTKEKYDGTGIGLAITKKIIDKHNGLITANSEEGKGSCFQFILPVRQFKKR